MGRSSSAFELLDRKVLPEKKIVRNRQSTGSAARPKTWVPNSKKANELRQAYDGYNVTLTTKSPTKRLPKRQNIHRPEETTKVVHERMSLATEKHVNRLITARNISNIHNSTSKSKSKEKHSENESINSK